MDNADQQSFPKVPPLDVATLSDLFNKRVALSADEIAYRQHIHTHSGWRCWCWKDIAAAVRQWQAGLHSENLARGTRVALMLPNSPYWVICDQAALALGLVIVPIFTHDNAGNVDHILRDSDTEVLITDVARFATIKELEVVQSLKRVIILDHINDDIPQQQNVVASSQWLQGKTEIDSALISAEDIATLIYTSGTTGKPKGVILTHRNILSNVEATLQSFPMEQDNVFLSFLPLSHVFERTAGYYMSMYLGAQVVFSRSVQQLKEDMEQFRPTVLLCVPRVYDSIYAKIIAAIARPHLKPLQKLFETVTKTPLHQRQRIRYRLASKLLEKTFGKRIRAIFGGNMRYALSGGAALSPEVASAFIAMGVPLYQGYGLTETSPVISVNRRNNNVPGSIGPPIAGVEVKIGENDELLTRSQYVMQAYWKLPQASAQAIDEDGWFHTGDQAKIDTAGRLYIIGRIKEIIVMSNGEKVPPVDMEYAIANDNLFDQVMVYGDNRSYLIAILVLNPDELARYDPETDWSDGDEVLSEKSFVAAMTKRVVQQIADFPSYAKVRRVILTREPWTVENGILTPTLKIKRGRVVARFREQIEAAYRSL